MPSNPAIDLEDIEDIITENSENIQRKSIENTVVPHPRITTFKENKKQLKGDKDAVIACSIIPGTQSIYVKTWGCTHNTSDSEYMSGQLAAFGYKITDDSDAADLWLLNSCTVKNPAEDHFRNMIEKGQKMEKPLVVAGCVSQGAPRQEYIKGLSLIGVQQIDRVVEVVEETLKGNTVRLLGQKKLKSKRLGGASLDLPKIRRNPLIEIISINTGCLNACTYCKTKHARGELGSYPVDQIVERAKKSFEEGVVELWLTSEDTGAYGRDIGTSLPELLWQLIDVIPEKCMMRVGMTNPPYILEHLEEIAKILNHPRVYSFLHVPVQSGCDRTLYEMRREYTVADFCHVIDFLTSRVPGISIATDIICGFPTETEEDFQETLHLCEKYKFPSLFMNQFFPRPGTPAARMPQIDRQEIKRRTKRLSELFQSYKPYSHQLGKRQVVLVTEIAHDGKHYVAHNKFYEQVLVSMDEDLMGKSFEVEIYDTGKHFLRGRRIGPIAAPNRIASLPKGQVSGVKKETICQKKSEKAMESTQSNSALFIFVIIAVLISFLLKQNTFLTNLFS